eukprot:CAMPEP_0201527394 /NCGR_PEP_ID=MMETSP0161_2-20130828/35060_1 /ASSEMBLY_ACC=CAM_ASM_000251 /TAXON_ID=180227 /ORGANISM="Neoparamoeba aestuarina, Strain SoJaBio B1-5/56/2" /LENGTH=162 /DNA_ID=CAMNT_0047928219 /DNA_START=118 /DNA_END=603 /DNA_ORIENTATION=-
MKGVGSQGFLLLFFFFLFLGTWEVEGRAKGSVLVEYHQGEGVMWNYTYSGNVLPMEKDAYLWLYVCAESYTCASNTPCQTHVLDPQEPLSGRYGVLWENPVIGDYVVVTDPDGTEKDLSETSYVRSATDLGTQDVQFLKGPGCQFPPSPPTPTPTLPPSSGW